MGRRFRGESRHKVDAKGRVSIPASFRRVIEASDPNWTSGQAPELVIVYGDQRLKYLECYTIEAIEEVDAKIDAMPRGAPERVLMERRYHSFSFPTSIDETGRLVLPPKLREKIGLKGEALFMAAGDTFQIWHPETYDANAVAEAEALLEGLPANFDERILLDGKRLEDIRRNGAQGE